MATSYQISAIWTQVTALLVSSFLLERSADEFLDSVSAVARFFGVDEALISLLTAGVEWEELVVILSSVGTGHNTLAYSNVIGSCIANILAGYGLGLVCLPSGIEYSSSTKAYVIVQLLITAPTVAAVINVKSMDPRLCCVFFFGLFLAYFGITLVWIWQGSLNVPLERNGDEERDRRSSRHENDANSSSSNEEMTGLLSLDNSRPRIKVFYLILKLFLSGAVMSMASYFITTSLTTLLERFRWTESTGGLTILSLITTLPEKLIAILAGRRGQVGVIVGGTAGSNIFLLTICLGIIFSRNAPKLQIRSRELYCVLFCSLAFAGIVLLQRKTNRMIGWLLSIAYVVFVVFEVMLQSS